MTTHELADLLANIALVLRHMPDVPAKALQPVERPIEADKIAAGVRQDRSKQGSGNLPDWIVEEEEDTTSSS